MTYWKILLQLPIAILCLFFFLRIMGNKEMQQSTPIEVACVVLLASMAWDVIFGGQYIIPHMILMMVVLVIVIYLIDWLTYKFSLSEKLFFGEPEVIVQDGRALIDVMEKNRISHKELAAKLRAKGVFDIKEVEVAVLEISGDLSVKKKEDS